MKPGEGTAGNQPVAPPSIRLRYEDWPVTNEYNASPLRDRVYACGSYSADLGEILDNRR